FSNSTILTTGIFAGAVASSSANGGSMTLRNSSIETRGDSSDGAITSTGGVVNLVDTQVRAGGASSLGIRALGAVTLTRGSVVSQQAQAVVAVSNGTMSATDTDLRSDCTDVVDA